ncbi:DUF6843 domain-containing protein [Sporosarcina ureilytica]|uniref:DUF6843 domain-containing protein n=1 Tax=Sporosarcina ureilytica TaxID=298596 RepID=A0A1D8JH46_9BACL|nr:hypothetical protein [Sporosarcina ureilytica]AOV08026.1 hypothetical protein BI350_11085 [Sporosarcina ureilytica]
MRFLKIIFSTAILSSIISLIVSLITYIPVSKREPNVYYFSVWESFFFLMIYITPILLMLSITAYIFYLLFGKITRFSHIINVFLSIVMAAFITSIAIFFMNKTTETNDIYLISEGFEGDVYAFYNVKGAPMVETEDGYEVHVINEKGYFVTSELDMDYGTVTDQYFYVDEKGNRTPISHKCISPFGTGGFSTSAGDVDIDFRYTGFRLTKDKCSDEFMTENHGLGENAEKIIGEILQEYYGVEQ